MRLSFLEAVGKHSNPPPPRKGEHHEKFDKPSGRKGESIHFFEGGSSSHGIVGGEEVSAESSFLRS